MASPHYRLLAAFAASVSLLVAGCAQNRPSDDAIQLQSKFAVNTQMPVATDADGMNTEATIFTVLGLARKRAPRQGLQAGPDVSPSLWNAAHDALQFASIRSEDPIAGVMSTEWYSPPSKPNERLRLTVYILSRSLRSDSLSLKIEREERAGAGWQSTPVAQKTVDDLEAAILQRARHIHAESYQDQTYKDE